MKQQNSHILLVSVQIDVTTLETSLALSDKFEDMYSINLAILLLGMYPEHLRMYASETLHNNVQKNVTER